MIGRVLFWLMTALYLLLYIRKTTGYYSPWVSDYLADLLCLPIVLSFCLFVMKKWRVVSRDFELTKAMIIATIVYFSIVFEWILPSLSNHHHGDVLDIVAYSLGALAYYFFRKTQVSKNYEAA